MLRGLIFTTLILTGLLRDLHAAEPVPQAVIQQTIAAVGGEEKLLKLFRIKERLILGEKPEGKGIERTSVLQPPGKWWVGKKERVAEEREPAVFLVWAWTLAPLLDEKSKLETLPAQEISARATYGIRVSGSIDPSLDMYFDQETRLLTRIDWRRDQHLFSEWKEVDGLKYAAKCTGFKPTGKAWYHTEILSLERLAELPAELKP